MAVGSLAFHQRLGKLEWYHQLIVAGKVVESTTMVKSGKKVMQVVPAGGVPWTVCVIPACSEIISSPRTLASHWADCHELYIWYY